MARGRPSKKQFILDVAQQLFSERGYQGTSIDLVVRLSKVSKPTVYNNFPSKLVLLQTLIEAQLGVMEERHSILLESEIDPIDRLYHVFQATLENDFEVAILRIFYGEQYKLEIDCIDLCQRFVSQIERTATQALASLELSQQHCAAIIALYKNALLTEHLQGKPVINSAELKSQLQVLGLA
jgi:AcrR family transcriptional regulator